MLEGLIKGKVDQISFVFSIVTFQLPGAFRGVCKECNILCIIAYRNCTF